MALRHFIFRCPSCGHDPMVGKGDSALCTACGSIIARGARQPLHLRIRNPAVDGGRWKDVPAVALARQIEDHGGAVGPATGADGRMRWSAEALLRTSSGERPVHWQARLLGFFEAFSPGLSGTFRLEHDELCFEPARGTEVVRWSLLALRSLQSASSSVQFTTGQGDLVHLAFDSDSPRRWEALLRHALQRAWLDAGRGEIVEVQPRIRTRPLGLPS